MKRLSVLAILAALAAAVHPCSIVAYAEAGRAYFCGNEDWSFTDPAIMTMKAAKGEYGVVLIGWASYLPSYPQAGINAEGLCFDWAMVPRGAYAGDPSKRGFDVNSTLDLLKRCRTVDEALKYLDGLDIPHLAEEHLVLADRSGASCVVEYAKGARKAIRSSGKPLYVTNFNLADREAGGYPCARYAEIERTLSAGPADEGSLAALLSRVHQEGAYPTIYSYVIDLKAMRMRIYFNHDYSTSVAYDVGELVGRRSLIPISR